MARVGDRAAQDYRSAEQSHGTGRERGGGFRFGDSVDAGLWVFEQADDVGVGPPTYHTGLDCVDEAARLHALCGARRRLGRFHYGADGATGTAGIDRHSREYAGYGSSRRGEGITGWRPAAIRSFSG